MAKRIKIGDIVEIALSKGFAYAQYTHAVGKNGAVIRILDGVFVERPVDFTEIVAKKHRFISLFPLSLAVHKGIFEVVGHAVVPDEYIKFPLFRAGNANEKGEVAVWWLWDGEKSWPIGKLTKEQYSLPIQAIPNDTALIKKIEQGWTPENDRRR
jgi:hypothetical protein